MYVINILPTRIRGLGGVLMRSELWDLRLFYKMQSLLKFSTGGILIFYSFLWQPGAKVYVAHDKT